MLKNLSQLEHKIGDRIFQFICDPNSPIAEVKDALAQMLGYVVQIETAAKAAADAENQKDPVIENIEE